MTYEKARVDALREVAVAIVGKWIIKSGSDIRLQIGEATAQELRSIKAVLLLVQHEICDYADKLERHQ